MQACGLDIRVSGKVIRTARIHGDSYRFIEDAGPILADLRNCGRRIDLFTFMQSAANPTPQYDYPLDWDNLAAAPISTQAKADTENNDEKRKARYKETDHVKTFYRVNRYPS